MKRLFTLYCCTLLVLMAYGQNTNDFTIRGQLKNVEEGTVISLMQQMGNLGISVTTDTLRNGNFFLKWQVEDTSQTEEFSLSVEGKGFPSMGLPLWVRAGSEIEIVGSDKWLHTWDVKSYIPEQIERTRFVNASKEDWIEYQRLSAQRNTLYENFQNITEEEYKKIRTIADSLDLLSDPYMHNINLKELELLEQGPISDFGLNRLSGLALSMKYSEDSKSLRPRVEAIYEKLTDEQKNNRHGRIVQSNLFPPQVVKVGEAMIDADVFDLEGKKYKLSDFKGKYIMLDFWSTGCGPCIMAMPEMKELAEKYKDTLNIISLSLDTKKGWKIGSEAHEITWVNLSDGEEMLGIAAKYGVKGMPMYIMISPEGIIMDTWMGYGKGSLGTRLDKYIKIEK